MSVMLLAVGLSYAERQWGQTNSMQGMPVRDKGLSVSLQANKYYVKHINGLSGLRKCFHYLHTDKLQISCYNII